MKRNRDLGLLGGMVGALIFVGVANSAAPPSAAESTRRSEQGFLRILGSRPGFGYQLKDGSSIEMRLGEVVLFATQYKAETYRFSVVAGSLLGGIHEWYLGYGVVFRLDHCLQFHRRAGTRHVLLIGAGIELFVTETVVLEVYMPLFGMPEWTTWLLF